MVEIKLDCNVFCLHLLSAQKVTWKDSSFLVINQPKKSELWCLPSCPMLPEMHWCSLTCCQSLIFLFLRGFTITCESVCRASCSTVREMSVLVWIVPESLFSQGFALKGLFSMCARINITLKKPRFQFLTVVIMLGGEIREQSYVFFWQQPNSSAAEIQCRQSYVFIIYI